MGAFYNSIQVLSGDRDRVKAALESLAGELRKKFLLGVPLGKWIAVYPDNSGQDERCAASLSKQLGGLVLHVMVHDSDVFFYNLFQNGESLNEYSSKPDYFEEAPPEEHERLKPKPDLFRPWVTEGQFDELTRLLERDDEAEKFVFEENRLEKFADLLGIRNSLTSYEYLMDGEHDGIKSWKEFIHVPDQNAEKAAKKAAEAALRAEKQRLQKEGLLCMENLPRGRKQQRINSHAEFCFDPLDGSLLVLWYSFIGVRQPPEFLQFRRPWEPGRPSLQLSFPISSPSHMMMSKTGKWLAFVDNHKLRLCHWRTQQLIEDVKTTGCPITFSHDETLLLCQSQRKYELISLETRQVIQTVETDSQAKALHPSNKFLITTPSQDRLGIVNLESGKLEKVLFSGKKMDLSHLASLFEETVQRMISQQQLDDWKSHLIQGSAQLLNLKCSPDGKMLFCATTAGLRVLAWDDVLTASEATPEPLFAITPDPHAVAMDHRHYINFIYDVILDEAQQRLLFCGIEGTIRFLNLNDGTAGILLKPPGICSLLRLQLSPDREVICCATIPKVENRNKESWAVQVWNYPALCKAAGLT